MIRLCFGWWGQRPQCPQCEDAPDCLLDLVYVQLAICAEALPEGSTPRDLALCAGKPVVVVQRAFAQVFGTPVSAEEETSEVQPLARKWWHSRPARPRGLCPARQAWSPKLAQMRWERGLRRRPILRKLYPGMVLERVWGEQLHQVLIPEDWGYIHLGYRHPTLYAVLTEICGRHEISQSPSLREARTDRGRVWREGYTRRQPYVTDGVAFFGIEKLLGGE